MLIVRGVIGGILLFLGHELNFLFAGAMAALLGIRLTPLLPPQWPYWSDYVFIIGLGVIAAAAVLLNERAGYFISGFLAGGLMLVEYYAPEYTDRPLASLPYRRHHWLIGHRYLYRLGPDPGDGCHRRCLPAEPVRARSHAGDPDRSGTVHRWGADPGHYHAVPKARREVADGRDWPVDLYNRIRSSRSSRSVRSRDCSTI